MTYLKPTVPLGRLPYLASGVLLLLLKFGVDALVAHLFGRPYSPMVYVDPSTAPLFHPGAGRGYWVVLWCTTMPFATVGLLLTLRRLRDAGVSPWLCGFFFVPFANLLFFIATALLPPSRTDGTAVIPATVPFRSQDIVMHAPGTTRSRSAAILYAGVLGSVVALGGFGVSVGLMGKYGYGLALGTPLIGGFVTGAWVPRLLPSARVRDALIAMTFTLALSFALIIVFALEGLGCLVLFVPLLALPAIGGTLLGFVIGKSMPVREHSIAATGSILLLLGTFGVEALLPETPHEAAMVETSMLIDAPPETVWPFVVRVADMPEPTEYPFDIGVSYPVRATLDSEGVGAVRRCEFNTGTAVETVLVWDVAKRLRFRIDSQPDPLRELTLYRTVRQPHLDGAVRNRLGELELVPIDGGRRTRLVGRSWYETRLHPAAYWEAYSDLVIHAIHTRVMTNVKLRAEAPPGVAMQP